MTVLVELPSEQTNSTSNAIGSGHSFVWLQHLQVLIMGLGRLASCLQRNGVERNIITSSYFWSIIFNDRVFPVCVQCGGLKRLFTTLSPLHWTHAGVIITVEKQFVVGEAFPQEAGSDAV